MSSILNEKNKIDIIEGHGKFYLVKVSVTKNKETTEYKGQNIIIATGARSRDSKLTSRRKKIIGYKKQ